MYRLRGIINVAGASSRSCVIDTIQGTSFFCDKNILYGGISDGSKVEFEVIPDGSQKNGWKVIGVWLAPVTNIKRQKYLETVDLYRDMDELDEKMGLECGGSRNE